MLPKTQNFNFSVWGQFFYLLDQKAHCAATVAQGKALMMGVLSLAASHTGGLQPCLCPTATPRRVGAHRWPGVPLRSECHILTTRFMALPAAGAIKLSTTYPRGPFWRPPLCPRNMPAPPLALQLPCGTHGAHRKGTAVPDSQTYPQYPLTPQPGLASDDPPTLSHISPSRSGDGTQPSVWAGLQGKVTPRPQTSWSLRPVFSQGQLAGWVRVPLLHCGLTHPHWLHLQGPYVHRRCCSEALGVGLPRGFRGVTAPPTSAALVKDPPTSSSSPTLPPCHPQRPAHPGQVSLRLQPLTVRASPERTFSVLLSAHLPKSRRRDSVRSYRRSHTFVSQSKLSHCMEGRGILTVYREVTVAPILEHFTN